MDDLEKKALENPIMQQQMEACKMSFYGDLTPRQVCNKLGIERMTLDQWKAQPWWKEAFHLWNNIRQLELAQSFAEQDKILLEAYIGVLTGDPNYCRPGQAGSIMKALEIRFKSGREPVLTNVQHVEHTTVEKKADPKEVEAKIKLAGMKNPAALEAYARSGNIEDLKFIDIEHDSGDTKTES